MGRNWTYNELLLAFNLYCKLSFGRYDRRTPEVIDLAKLIDRTPSAVAMKLSNFASLDPRHISRGIKGLSNTSKADKDAWQEFTGNWDKTVWESELLLAQLRKQDIKVDVEAEVFGDQAEEFMKWDNSNTRETQIERLTKVRLGQQFFRKTILANYRSRCCVCNMPIPTLLIASHIIPWKDREDLRLNPHNGLCLCALHDKAFDAGFLGIDEQYRVVISDQVHDYLPNQSLETNIARYGGREISLPDKFVPNQAYLKHHLVTHFLLVE